MAQVMNIEITKKETTKPSSPTPHSLKSFKEHMVIWFFCTPTMSMRNHSGNLNPGQPLAGRIKDNIFIDCNDEGAVYLEALVNSLLSSFLDQPDFDFLELFLPIEIGTSEAATGPLLLVKACGRLAISVCFAHKLADASMLGIFIEAWSATSLGIGDTVVPDFSNAATKSHLEISQC
ncbi:hypothetical protein DVH24_040985 [Malus domestica]|uniref:Uncharacterized protein n=1 Tax=Malus domestica TaxID=3750 RepID=A0A498I7W0_MALDO|nr:hypothetical protein DVH24_040985 [Malus domestica]